jgi:hypothetical protein
MQTSDDVLLNKQSGTAGWKQFLMAKWDIVQAYERAKYYSQAHIVQTSHGNVAAAAIRAWLERFLPKRFGVCNGYIASQQQKEPYKFPHFDIIIFDQMRSPILWHEENLDSSMPAMARAIPAEFVYCVMEIKSRLTSENVQEALEHLALLLPLYFRSLGPQGRFISTLPPNFVTYAIFLEMLEDQKYSNAILQNLCFADEKFAGAIALKGQGLDLDYTWRTDRFEGPIEACDITTSFGRKDGQTHLLNPDFGGTGPAVDLGNGIGTFVMAKWSINNFSRFAFDLLSHLNGTFDSKYPSLYGFTQSQP